MPVSGGDLMVDATVVLVNDDYSCPLTATDGILTGEPSSIPDGDPNHVNVVVVAVTVCVVGPDPGLV